jgi:hypothetical protein
MKLKKILTDPSFWILLLLNIWLVWSYEKSPQIFTTLIWLYWSQSVLFGFFNFLDMLTTTNVADASTLVLNKETEQPIKLTANASAWAFLFHYGFFHFGYFIFLVIMKKTGPFEWDLFEKVLAIFIVFQAVNFIQHKIQNKTKAANIGSMFAIPYIRIVPMHLCILLPAFFHWSNLTVFLVLKVIADVIMYIVTNSYYKKSDPITAVTAINIDSTIS